MQSVTSEYQIHFSANLRDSVLFMVDNPDVSHLVFHFKGQGTEYQNIVRIIQEINSLLPIILVPQQNYDQVKNDFLNQPNIIVLGQNMDLSKVLARTLPNRRRANRVTWPLRASFYNASNPDLMETGQIISLSILGAYIKTPNLDLLNQQNIMMEIAFTDFKFLVEGVIKRINREMNQRMPLGFAVEFVHISPATSAYINSLINDKLLNALIETSLIS